MQITLPDVIYAIVREENGKLTLKTYPLILESEPSDSELRQYFNYSVSLGDQYASDLRYLGPTESLAQDPTGGQLMPSKKLQIVLSRLTM